MERRFGVPEATSTSANSCATSRCRLGATLYNLVEVSTEHCFRDIGGNGSKPDNLSEYLVARLARDLLVQEYRIGDVLFVAKRVNFVCQQFFPLCLP